MHDYRRLTLMLIASLLSACATLPEDRAQLIPADSRQLVVVTTPGWDAPVGTLQTFARDGSGWTAASEPADVSVGRTGAAWGRGLHPDQPGLQKVEGDGRSPAGIFSIGVAFGYADSAVTALNYKSLDADDWCIDVNGSPLYNRIVNSKVVGIAAIVGSSEPMRRDLHLGGDQRYREGFVIEHNPARVPAGGSCIFAHLWAEPSAPTAGCTAMGAADMTRLLAWLDARQQPLFVLLPTHEYARLQSAWGLPAVPGVGGTR